jgi:hypothetical protein
VPADLCWDGKRVRRALSYPRFDGVADRTPSQPMEQVPLVPDQGPVQ